MRKFGMAYFVLVMVGILSLLTIFFFPTSEPGSVRVAGSFEELAKPDIVKLAPAFGRGKRTELYSFNLAPNLDKYAEDIPPSEKVILLATSVERKWNGDTSSDWSFAWRYWVLIDVIPSVVLTYAVLWILRKKKTSETSVAVSANVSSGTMLGVNEH